MVRFDQRQFASGMPIGRRSPSTTHSLPMTHSPRTSGRMRRKRLRSRRVDTIVAHAESHGFAPFGGADYRDAVGPTVHFATTASERDPWAPNVSETDTAFYKEVGANRVDRALGTAWRHWPESSPRTPGEHLGGSRNSDRWLTRPRARLAPWKASFAPLGASSAVARKSDPLATRLAQAHSAGTPLTADEATDVAAARAEIKRGESTTDPLGPYRSETPLQSSVTSQLSRMIQHRVQSM